MKKITLLNLILCILLTGCNFEKEKIVKEEVPVKESWPKRYYPGDNEEYVHSGSSSYASYIPSQELLDCAAITEYSPGSMSTPSALLRICHF